MYSKYEIKQNLCEQQKFERFQKMDYFSWNLLYSLYSAYKYYYLKIITYNKLKNEQRYLCGSMFPSKKEHKSSWWLPK
jgi:hypothetical protein